MTTGGVARALRPTSLAEVLDIILDKGIVIDADIRVSVIGIELISIDARIVIASIDTYLQYADVVGRIHLEREGRVTNLHELGPALRETTGELTQAVTGEGGVLPQAAEGVGRTVQGATKSVGGAAGQATGAAAAGAAGRLTEPVKKAATKLAEPVKKVTGRDEGERTPPAGRQAPPGRARPPRGS